MKVKTLHSFSKGDISETDWDMPEMREDQIMIETKLCGICRSDIMSFSRQENMPYVNDNGPGIVGRYGHEGLGKVIKVGKLLKDVVKEGQIVSTWSDPAYADCYYANEKEFTIVPEISHKYILQPVACAINIISKTLSFSYKMYYDDTPEILLLGTGFMSIIIGQYAAHYGIKLTVVGSSNKNEWDKLGLPLHSIDEIRKEKKKYKVVIDLTSKAENFHIITKEFLEMEGLFCYASTPSSPVTTNFFENCWNCNTIIMPSPRNKDFKEMMDFTCRLIQEGILTTDFIWSKGYNRRDMNEVKQAFDDGLHRNSTYIRGYLNF